MTQPLLSQSLDQLANASMDDLHVNLLNEFPFLILTDLTLILMIPPSAVINLVLSGLPFAAILAHTLQYQIHGVLHRQPQGL